MKSPTIQLSFALIALTATWAPFANAQTIEQLRSQSPRNAAIEIKLGSYLPLIDREASLAPTLNPYADTFTGGMLLLELETDRQLWQKVGSLGVGIAAGYAEKYGWARIDATNEIASERTALFVLPLKLLGVYRFDYAAIQWNVPVVPYVKFGLAATPWWVNKGAGAEKVNGETAGGIKWGYAGVAGVSLMLDFLDQRLARDFDSDLGVNHSYLFAEYVYEEVNNFGRGGLDLSSRRWMFGLMLEY